MKRTIMTLGTSTIMGLVVACANNNYSAGVQPLSVQAQSENRDRYEGVADNTVKLVSAEPVSTFSIDVDTASYANVRRFLQDGVLPPADAVRIEEMINYFDYDYPSPSRADQPFAADLALFTAPWDAGSQLLRIGIKGYASEPAERPRTNLVFLVDTSGSMQSPDRLPLLKRSFAMLVEELRPDDRIAIVAYADSAGVVLESTPGNEKRAILRALNDLHAGGSTAGGEGIDLAYRLAEEHFEEGAVNRVILATDGDFNVGISDSHRLEDFITEKRESGVYLSVLGFGRGNLNDLVLQKLVQAGNGHASYIDNLMEARKVLVDEMGSTLFPIADDVKIQIEFNPEVVAEYRLIGYETRLLAREDFNNDRVDAGEIGSGPYGDGAVRNHPGRQSVPPDRRPPLCQAGGGERRSGRGRMAEAALQAAGRGREPVDRAARNGRHGHRLRDGAYGGALRDGRRCLRSDPPSKSPYRESRP